MFKSSNRPISRRFLFKSLAAVAASVGFAHLVPTIIRPKIFVMEVSYKDRNGGSFSFDHLRATVSQWLDIESYEVILSRFQAQGKILSITKSLTSHEYKTWIKFASQTDFLEFDNLVTPLRSHEILVQQSYHHVVTFQG